MNKQFATVLFAALLSNLACAAESSSLIYLKGNRQAVVAMVEKSLREEVPKSAPLPLTGAVGYQVNFFSMMSQNSTLRVQLEPVANSLITEPDTFKATVTAWVQAGMAQDILHLGPLRAQLTKQAAAANVQVLTDQDVVGFRPLSQISDDCFDALARDPDLSSIAGKVSLTGTKPSLMQLASDETVSPTEKEVIALWSSKRDRCWDVWAIGATFYPNNEQVNIGATTKDTVDLLIVELYKGRLTYGDFAKKRVEVRNLADAKSAEKYKEALAATAKEADLQQQRAIQRAAIDAQNQANNILLLQATQPKPAPASRTINCESNRFGNSVQTTCN